MATGRGWLAAALTVVAVASVVGVAATAPGSATVDEQEPGRAGGSPAGAPALPTDGVVRFGTTFAGVSLGMSRSEVESVWGSTYGLCRDCSSETRYYTYEPFMPEGAGVEFAGDRVVAAFTLWQPQGWRSAGGLTLGTPTEEIPAIYLELPAVDCVGYEAFVQTRRDAKTVLYVYDGALWAYALMSRTHPVCR